MKKINNELINELKFMSDLKASPSGRYLAYTIKEPKLEDNSYESQIHVYDLERKKQFQLTNYKLDSFFTFLADDSIVFTRSSAKPSKELTKSKTEIYRIHLSGGEAKVDFELPLLVTDIRLVDEKRILVQASSNTMSRLVDSLSDEELAKRQKELQLEADYAVAEELPFWLNGRSYLNQAKLELYLYNLETQALEQIGKEHDQITLHDVKDDKIVFTYSQPEKLMSMYNYAAIYDLSTKEREEIAGAKPLSFYRLAFGEAGIFVFASDKEKYGLNEDSKVYHYQEGKLSLVSEDGFFGNTIAIDTVIGGGKSFYVKDDTLIYSVSSQAQMKIQAMDLAGKISKLSPSLDLISGFVTIKDSIYLTALDQNSVIELYHLRGDSLERLSNYNENLEEYAVSPVEEFSFDFEGRDIPVYVIKPLYYEEGQKYPAVLTVHGGPKAAFGKGFNHEMQALAAGGYFVYYLNPLGSSSYGREWADLRGRYGQVDYAQLMAATDAVLEQYPGVDESKLAVIGGSYGGFMCNWIIGQTKRFKAAVTQRSISNWISMYGVSDIGYFFVSDQCGCNPWDDFDELWRQSPLKYAQNIQTPTLVIHADNDYRCPLGEGVQMYSALVENGVKARLVVFKGENHELSRSGKPAHRLRRLDEIKNWLDQALQA